MRFDPLHRLFAGFTVSLVVVLSSACAYGMPEANPEDIPRLQAGIQANPDNTDLQVQLGMAQYKAEDFEAARTALQGAVDAGNQSGAAFLYLGLTQEHFEDWDAARSAYNEYLQVGKSDQLKDELRKRLQLIAQQVLKQQAEQAIAQETQLSSEPPTPRSVAILPFGFNSDRDDLEPLIYALSDMMITDFAVSNALTVLERAQIQSLLDEMALTEAGYAEPGTGARAGRLLRAENVVQGVITTLGQDELRLDTDVLNIPRGASSGSLTAEDQLQNLFDMEKDLVFRTLRDVLGVELTPAEEQQIRDNRAQNILAFLAYGRGLRERDRGNYDAALQQFRQAQQLDPSFGAAGDAAGATSDMSDATTTGTSGVEQTATTTGEVGGAGAIEPPPATLPTTTVGTGGTTPASTGNTGGSSGTSGTINNVAQVDPPPNQGVLGATGSGTTATGASDPSTTNRDPNEGTTGEGVTPPVAVITIVITRPGGGV